MDMPRVDPFRILSYTVPRAMIFKDDFDNIVDPEVLDYKYFLKDQTKTDLLSLAKLANLSIESNLRKEDLISFLSVEIPKVLPTLVDKLDSKDRLKCEIIVSSGGVHVRMGAFY
jgi:hypothetical protein